MVVNAQHPDLAPLLPCVYVKIVLVLSTEYRRCCIICGKCTANSASGSLLKDDGRGFYDIDMCHKGRAVYWQRLHTQGPDGLSGAMHGTLMQLPSDPCT